MNLKNFKLSKLHYFILYLFLTFWLFARSGLNSDIGAFKYTHYLFNYEYEFLKRGLLGELFRLSFDKVNSQIIYIVSFFFLLILSTYFFKIFFLDFNKEKNIHKFIFSIMVFTSPFTMQHFIFDIGRQDIINLLITFFKKLLFLKLFS